MAKNKGVFLVSLNSPKLEDFLNQKRKVSIEPKIDSLDILVFDVYEILNGLFFNERNVRQQQLVIENAIQRVQDGIVNVVPKNRKLILFSKIQKGYSEYMSIVYKEYFSNSHFMRHCKYQIYKNLHPKLKTVYITNNESPLLEIVAPFLLAEIAFFLYNFHKGEYQAMFGLEGEMEIIAEIRNGKYSEFNPYLNNKIPVLKIDFE